MGDALYAREDYRAALGQHAAALRERPRDAECHYRVALDYLGMESHESARFYLEQAVQMNPAHARAHATLADLLVMMGEADKAAEHARRATELAPGDPDLAVVLASVLEADRKSEQAWEIVDRLRGAGHDSERFALLFSRMAARRDSAGEALGLIERLLGSGRSIRRRDRASLHFAAAQLLDSAGRYDEAFRHASEANVLRGVAYDPALTERLVDSFIRYFTRPALQRLPRATHGIDVPVFIVGMPRSGTSLVEQVLASHPEVHGAGERDWIFRLWEVAAQRQTDPAQPLTDCLEQMSANVLNDLAAQYLNPLLMLSPLATRITDKTPANFLHLGLIAVLFPRARVIHCRRDPMDTGLSCFMTDFAGGHGFSHSLGATGHFYRQNERMMAHWKSVLDLPILEVEYEKMVTDLRGQAGRMLEFLGLPWDERCMGFHENRRFVATASNAQVRQPIYDRSVGRWLHYQAHLAPLRAALAGEPL